jgi:hypothetical protein
VVAQTIGGVIGPTDKVLVVPYVKCGRAGLIDSVPA